MYISSKVFTKIQSVVLPTDKQTDRQTHAGYNITTLTALLHKTISDRAFPVAAARVWYMLPPAIASLLSL